MLFHPVNYQACVKQTTVTISLFILFNGMFQYVWLRFESKVCLAAACLMQVFGLVAHNGIVMFGSAIVLEAGLSV